MEDRLPQFQAYILRWYELYGRHQLPWRQTTEPYHILLSELMLQQTQVDRVIPKYQQFLQLFPTVSALACAPQATVLQAWQGLGYNRRARFLHRTAQAVVQLPDQQFPNSRDELLKLPGVGPYTSGAIMAFAFNQPVTLIETNVRTVFLYHFFPNQSSVPDAQLLPLVAATVPTHAARTWYAAVMDYGSHLKKVVVNPNRRSRSYTKQSKFEGSIRQVRGALLRALATGKSLTSAELQEAVEHDIKRAIDTRLFAQILQTLMAEAMVHTAQDGTRFSL